MTQLIPKISAIVKVTTGRTSRPSSRLQSQLPRSFQRCPCAVRGQVKQCPLPGGTAQVSSLVRDASLRWGAVRHAGSSWRCCLLRRCLLLPSRCSRKNSPKRSKQQNGNRSAFPVERWGIRSRFTHFTSCVFQVSRLGIYTKSTVRVLIKLRIYVKSVRLKLYDAIHLT